MIALIFYAALIINVQKSDGSIIECVTNEPVEYFPGVLMVTVNQCGPDVLFEDGFES